MRRTLLTAALAVASLFAVGGVANAQTPPPVAPEFAPPALAPVTDVPSAENFTKLYVSSNARRLLNTDRRRVRVINAEAACLQSPIVQTRFGCVFTLRALVIQRNRGWEGWSASYSHGKRNKHGKHGHDRPRFRVRQFGCLGFLRVDGGPVVTPTARVVNVECARIPRGDTEVVAPTDA